MRPACSLGLLLLLAASASAGELTTVETRKGAVVSVSPPATQVGVAILDQGGTAVDATVAVALALAVTHPAAGNIGGGGFMLVLPPDAREPVVYEYRETAPASVRRDTFVQESSVFTHRAVGVPGTLRGMELAHRKHGKLPWKALVTPAVKLARDGFPVSESLARSLNQILGLAKDHAEFRRVYGHPENRPWKAGDRLVQPDLAKTLESIAEGGADAFYAGPIADLLVAEMEKGRGFITREDLNRYKAIERRPVHGTYRGFDVYGPPPPSAGGICLVECLNMLEPFDVRKHPRGTWQSEHLLAEVMRRAYADRAQHLGDPDFTKIPEALTTKEFARERMKSFSWERATPSREVAPQVEVVEESPNTTHFSVIDASGMAVANTYTLEESYGSRVVVRGGGFLLNNEMGDFNWKPGVTSTRGRIGTPPNEVAPGKRMLSSQTPTLVCRDGKVLLITGSPGGRTITNTVLNVLVNVLDHEMPLAEAVKAPRLHQQWFPDELRREGLARNPDLLKELGQRGHRTPERHPTQGDAHSIRIDPKTGVRQAVADDRVEGSALGQKE